MMHVAVIFARGGSKGLLNKNLRPLCGKPLIAWSIEIARDIADIDRVIVSTDSEEIASVAMGLGAEVPFIRPSHLATDDSPEWLSWQHLVEYLRDFEGIEKPFTLVSLPTTSPLREKNDVIRCLNKFQQADCDAIITVSESTRSPYFNMVSLGPNDFARLAITSHENVARRQDAPELFDISTVCYLAKSDFILANESLFSGRVAAVKIDRHRSIDIDDILDFKIAEMLMKERIQNNKEDE
jgi:CMP-N-acetylneuraminic acid synthetase